MIASYGCELSHVDRVQLRVQAPFDVGTGCYILFVT
jgi:hypothetical protein